jgi:SHS family lactate transporter-like MFS transporter
VRGTFPGFTYQLGNLLAAGNATIQAEIAARHGDDYGIALAGTAIIVALVLAVFAGFGPEAREIVFTDTAAEETAPGG